MLDREGFSAPPAFRSKRGALFECSGPQGCDGCDPLLTQVAVTVCLGRVLACYGMSALQTPAKPGSCRACGSTAAGATPVEGNLPALGPCQLRELCPTSLSMWWH